MSMQKQAVANSNWNKEKYPFRTSLFLSE